MAKVRRSYSFRRKFCVLFHGFIFLRIICDRFARCGQIDKLLFQQREINCVDFAVAVKIGTDSLRFGQLGGRRQKLLQQPHVCRVNLAVRIDVPDQNRRIVGFLFALPRVGRGDAVAVYVGDLIQRQ